MAQRIHLDSVPPGRLARTVGEQRRARLEHVALVARRESYRRARCLVGDLTEQLGQLSAGAADPSEHLQLQESARLAVDTILRLLAGPGGGIPAVRHTSSDPGQLDEWVQLLDELLTDAQVGYDGAQARALALAASIAVGLDVLAGAEQLKEAR